MLRKLGLTAGLLSFTLLSGCPFLFAETTTVRLVNNGDFPILVDVRYDDDQNILEDILRNTGTLVQFTLQPGETQSFTRDCDDLQAVMIESADLQVLGQIGPQTRSNVLRDGDEFDCRDVISFTFDHSALLVDFNVTFNVQRN